MAGEVQGGRLRLPEMRMRSQGLSPELQPPLPLLRQLQVRVLGIGGGNIREHAPWPAYVVVRYEPRECVPQGRVRTLQLNRGLGIGSYQSAQSAWRTLRQRRPTMQNEECRETFESIVEISETCVGVKPREKSNHSDEDGDDGNEPKRGRVA